MEDIESGSFDMDAAMEDISGQLFEDGDSENSEETPAENVEPTQEADSTQEVEKAPTASPPQPTQTSVSPPKTWRAEALAEWEAVPEKVKAEILKREDDMFRGLESYKQDANLSRAIAPTFTEFASSLQALGHDPVKQLNSLMQIDSALRSDDKGKAVQVLKAVANHYGLDLEAEAPYQDPEILALKSHVQKLESKLTQREAYEQDIKRQSLEAEISTFASDPKNAYFDEVASDIAKLLKSGVAQDLQTAYDRAVWVNPVTRAKEQARLTAEASSSAQQKAESSKRASEVNLKTKARSVSATTPTGEIEDTLRETLASIRKRS